MIFLPIVYCFKISPTVLIYGKSFFNIFQCIEKYEMMKQDVILQDTYVSELKHIGKRMLFKSRDSVCDKNIHPYYVPRAYP